MSTRDKLRVTEAAERTVAPGRRAEKARARWHQWIKAGIIPPAVESEWGAGGLAFIFPESAAAIAAVLFDLFDTGAVTSRDQLASMWRYFAEAQHEGGEPLITHVLAEVEHGHPCFLVVTLWRHQNSGQIQPTCGVRFHEELERPFEAPSQFHELVTKCVTPLHLLLARFVRDLPTRVN